MVKRLAALTGLFLTLTAPAPAQTQITTGVIQGTVTDQSGALVPGASVEARNVDINFRSTQTTAADGRFVFLQLRPGPRQMPFKSQAQRRKFAQLLVEGKISGDTFEEWNRETGGRKLPERVSSKKKSRKRR